MKLLLAIIITIVGVVTFRLTVLSDDNSETSVGSVAETLESQDINEVEQPEQSLSALKAAPKPVITNTQDIPANAEAAELGLNTDPELIAQIEREMQFTPAPEGDLSYMSPEAETVQINEPFPAVEADPNMTLPGNDIQSLGSEGQQIGQELDPKTKMEDAQ